MLNSISTALSNLDSVEARFKLAYLAKEFTVGHLFRELKLFIETRRIEMSNVRPNTQKYYEIIDFELF